MKKLIILSSVVLFACQQPSGIEAKKAQLKELELELEVIESKISSLQEEIDAADTTIVRVDAIAVSIKEVQPEPFQHFITVEGVVEVETDVMVAAQYQGQIEKIHVEEGQKVKKGQLLASLNNKVISSQLKELRTRYSLAKELFERQERLWKENNIGSEMQYLEAKNNKESLLQNIRALQAQLDMTYIRAPQAGQVDQIFMKVGSFASPQAPFAQIVNLDDLHIAVDVSEKYLPMVQEGDSVLVNFKDLGIKRKLAISRVGNVINPQNRSFLVEIALDNETGILKPNALATVKIRDYASDSTLVLPSNSVQQDVNGYYVFLANGTGEIRTSEKNYVEIGLGNDRNQTEIQSGLKPGDEVVVAGYNQVSNGVKVRPQ